MQRREYPLKPSRRPYIGSPIIPTVDPRVDGVTGRVDATAPTSPTGPARTPASSRSPRPRVPRQRRDRTRAGCRKAARPRAAPILDLSRPREPRAATKSHAGRRAPVYGASSSHLRLFGSMTSEVNRSPPTQFHAVPARARTTSDALERPNHGVLPRPCTLFAREPRCTRRGDPAPAGGRTPRVQRCPKHSFGAPRAAASPGTLHVPLVVLYFVAPCGGVRTAPASPDEALSMFRLHRFASGRRHVYLHRRWRPRQYLQTSGVCCVAPCSRVVTPPRPRHSARRPPFPKAREIASSSTTPAVLWLLCRNPHSPPAARTPSRLRRRRPAARPAEAAARSPRVVERRRGHAAQRGRRPRPPPERPA
jgi:hypothetical protein